MEGMIYAPEMVKGGYVNTKRNKFFIGIYLIPNNEVILIFHLN